MPLPQGTTKQGLTSHNNIAIGYPQTNQIITHRTSRSRSAQNKRTHNGQTLAQHGNTQLPHFLNNSPNRNTGNKLYQSPSKKQPNIPRNNIGIPKIPYSPHYNPPMMTLQHHNIPRPSSRNGKNNVTLPIPASKPT